jgi:hypothetical protein
MYEKYRSDYGGSKEFLALKVLGQTLGKLA